MASRVKITLNAQARAEAVATREVRGIETPADFEGPDFKEVVNLGFEIPGFFGVELVDGTQYIYPSSSIARVAVYQS